MYEIFNTIVYVLYRLLPLLVLHILNQNIYHNFIITLVAEFFMLLDDIGLISYHTSKILGGTVFGIEKLLSYSSYMLLADWRMYPMIFITSYLLRTMYPKTEYTNVFYMIVVLIWLWACTLSGSWIQLLGAIIYTVTDFDVAIYDSKIFGIYLLPAYQFGLLLLSR